MPFLDGVATSVHGIVLPDGIAALRPVELVTLRQGHALRYSGCATFWDPPAAVREEMREAARRVGGRLRDEVGFRGAFTLDGVATADGFRPTELNPRFGAGLGVITRGLEGLPLTLVLDLRRGRSRHRDRRRRPGAGDPRRSRRPPQRWCVAAARPVARRAGGSRRLLRPTASGTGRSPASRPVAASSPRAASSASCSTPTALRSAPASASGAWPSGGSPTPTLGTAIGPLEAPTDVARSSTRP